MSGEPHYRAFAIFAVGSHDRSTSHGYAIGVKSKDGDRAAKLFQFLNKIGRSGIAHTDRPRVGNDGIFLR
jgi:hypothetical protein